MTTVHHFMHKNCTYGSSGDYKIELTKHHANAHTSYYLTIDSSNQNFNLVLFIDPQVRQDLLDVLSREPEEILE